MSSRSATLNISTPEGVTFSLPLAGPVTRSLAYFIDLALFFALWNVTALLLSPFMFFLQGLGAGMAIMLQFAYLEGMRMVMELLWRGQTVGKKLMGLRVVDEQGLKLRPSQVVIRNLLRFVDVLPAFYALGGMVSLFSARAQRLGDLAAGTVVVRTVKTQPPDVASVLAGKFNSFRECPHIEARLRQKVTPEEAQLALHALVRRDDLNEESRHKLYEQLAAHFREKVKFPEDVVFGLSDEQYIRNVVETVFRGRK
ncbi:RDD family protein [Roseimicrobium sp. ORNL1]|uniref:RDD family protein n=1 Tax=Roseimicrobium sp. ORNL1 TaxID=2711231 RepID=UPI0013E1D204|nr:RDD family protein [Roseimicrobium sp. ORNL1]QIF05040.1 RDD family protein [Roseimicrobium sp. ORNL1]